MPETPTRITNDRRRIAHGGTPAERSAKSSGLVQSCLDCGNDVTSSAAYCSDCQQRRSADWIPQLSERATDFLKQARAEGRDPAHGGDAAHRRGMKNRQRQLEARTWETTNNRPDPAVFTTTILPGLDSVSAGELARAIGLSRPYCSMIKRGAYVPHPKHWDAFARLSAPRRTGK